MKKTVKKKTFELKDITRVSDLRRVVGGQKVVPPDYLDQTRKTIG